MTELGPPDPRFAPMEAVLVLRASQLLSAAHDALGDRLSDDDKLDYLETAGRLFGLIHPTEYERIMGDAKVEVAAAILDVDGWPAGREQYEQLTDEQQAEVVARMVGRAPTIEPEEGP